MAAPDAATDAALTVRVTVNGELRDVRVAAHDTLLDMVRDEIGLTGTKECCAEGECGACTLLMDGHAVNSCLVLAAEADGHEITTIEALGARGHRQSRMRSCARAASSAASASRAWSCRRTTCSATLPAPRPTR